MAAPKARRLRGPKRRSAGAKAGIVGSRPASQGSRRPPTQPAMERTTAATAATPSTATPGAPPKAATVGAIPAARDTTAMATARLPSTIIATTAARIPAAESKGGEMPIRACHSRVDQEEPEDGSADHE